MTKVEKRILEVFPKEARTSASELAVVLGYNTTERITRGFVSETCPYITRVLLKLCRKGLIFQWIVGYATHADVSDYAPSYEMEYIWHDSQFALELLARRKPKYGYRF